MNKGHIAMYTNVILYTYVVKPALYSIALLTTVVQSYFKPNFLTVKVPNVVYILYYTYAHSPL